MSDKLNLAELVRIGVKAYSRLEFIVLIGDINRSGRTSSGSCRPERGRRDGRVQEWGELYERFYKTAYDPAAVSAKVKELYKSLLARFLLKFRCKEKSSYICDRKDLCNMKS